MVIFLYEEMIEFFIGLVAVFGFDGRDEKIHGRYDRMHVSEIFTTL